MYGSSRRRLLGKLVYSGEMAGARAEEARHQAWRYAAVVVKEPVW